MKKQNSNRDDRHPWEVTNPDEWLCKPYFRTNKPDWVEAVISIIKEGWLKADIQSKEITSADVRLLRYFVARDIQMRVEWNGFLSKADGGQLGKVTDTAKTLLRQLRALETDDTGSRKSRSLQWYVLAELGEVLTLHEADYRRFLRMLEVMTQIEVKSPRIKSVPGEQPSVLRSWKTGLRAELQRNLDGWWNSVTGLSQAKTEYKAMAFHQFLKEIFDRICLDNPPGATETAIANARKYYKKKDHDKEKEAERCVEAFGKHAKRLKVSPDGLT